MIDFSGRSYALTGTPSAVAAYLTVSAEKPEEPPFFRRSSVGPHRDWTAA
jgi:hypothetical protein